MQDIQRGVSPIFPYVVKDDACCLLADIEAPGISVSLGGIDHRPLLALASWHKEQTALFIVDDIRQVGILLTTFLQALGEEFAETTIEAEVILHDECPL